MKAPLAFATVVIVFASLGAGRAAAQDWSGPYVGGHVGYAFQGDDDGERITFDKNLDGQFTDTVTTAAGADAFSPGFCDGRASGNAPSAGCEDDEGGAGVGVRAGYDWQFSGWVVGGVVEYDASSVEDSVAAFSTTPASYTMTRELDGILSARVRAGYAMGRFLPYATAGLARASISHSFETTNTANSFTETSDDEASGYQLGLGLETWLTPRITLGVEYLWTELEDDGHRVRAGGPAPATNPFIIANPQGTDFRRSDEDFKVGSFRVVANFRF